MPPPLRILLVENDDTDADLVAAQLSAAGFPVEIARVRSIPEARRLASNVAHDFNNVLIAMFGYVDLLLDQFAAEDSRRADLEEIRRLAERAARLTRELLDVSRG